MIYLSAGHNLKGPTTNADPGAVFGNYQEANLTIIQRDLTAAVLDGKRIAYHTDSNFETLSQYLKRIGKAGNRTDIFLEYHFDAAAPPAPGKSPATGCTAVIGDEGRNSQLSKDMAAELVNVTAQILQIRNRGVITESQSARGRLGFMGLPGPSVILELGFITNSVDIRKWEDYRIQLAAAHADILINYEKLR